ncbi:MAG TPA: adenylosuccinate synthase [Candidatus Norongarragalinales archaeon]|nr:adenylosuccinate synthase [Candidatus Norongarragalinales archaeon]
MIRLINGAQWGDEGKGKVIDYLAEKADMVVRYQGGSNAGHTVVHNGKTHKFHLLPSGVVRRKRSLIGAGVVLDPRVLKQEIDEFGGLSEKEFGIDFRTPVIMPWHGMIDIAREGLKKQKIGTTGRGIGPAYEEKASRDGIRFCDLIEENKLREKMAELYPMRKKKLELLYGVEFPSEESIWKEYYPLGQELKKYVTDVSLEVNRASDGGKKILLEGAQGVLLDLSFGTYPYVTSSQPIAGGACVGIGLSPKKISEIEGVVKAYTTRVGSGPFPTELVGDEEELGNEIRENGHEFGTTTGRKRRIGWLDLPLLRYAMQLNGYTGFHYTKLDVLGGVEKLKIALAHKYDGKTLEIPSVEFEVLKDWKPVYKTLPGFEKLSREEWNEVVRESKGKGLKALPKNALSYLNFVEKELGVKTKTVSLGPAREETIFLSH